MSWRGLPDAIGMFTILPVPARGIVSVSRARSLLTWLPAIGVFVGALAGLAVTAIRAGAPHAGFLGAVLGIGLLAGLTRGLHLDGLADTADGLASHAPPAPALEIMRRSDIGPFGVVTLVFVLGLDIAALTTIRGGDWTPVAALALAAATGRLAVLYAAHPSVPSARPAGFGALVAGSMSSVIIAAQTALVLGGAALLGLAVDANLRAWLVAPVVALVLAAGLRWHTTRRFGGVTGDVFGALVEVATAVTLVGLALG